LLDYVDIEIAHELVVVTDEHERAIAASQTESCGGQVALSTR
jgi:hypothetical protein